MAYNEKLVEIKMSHLESNINDEKIWKRILDTAYMYLVDGKNLEEIAQIFDVSYDVVYRDMSRRLPKINEELAKLVSQEFKRRS